MIDEISIRDLGVIKSAVLRLTPGFTAVTGETGAGKTMILTALNLVLGGKSDSALVRSGSDRLTAAATFAVEAPVTIFRVYWICPGVSAIINLRFGVEKYL